MLRLRARAHPALSVAAVIFAVAWSALVVTHRPTPLAVPKATAIHRLLNDPVTARMLASEHWDRVEVTPVDRSYEILWFHEGPRVVASVTVGFNGKVVILSSSDQAREGSAYGSNIANDPRVLALLSILFVLMTAVWPLWRVRNLDVLVMASTVLSVVMFNDSMFTRMMLISYSALVYLAVRAAWWGLGSRRRRLPAIPLYEHLTRHWSVTQRLRVLRLMVIALALIVAMVGFTSLHVLDVGYAVMEGATLITHGVLPYGHIPDVLHGDTYPLGSYLLYVPFAWIWPVHSVWDQADVTLAVAVVAAVLAAAGLSRVTSGGWVAVSDTRLQAERGSRLRTAIAVLAFPPLLVTVSTGTTDVVLAAMFVIALMLAQRPVAVSATLTGAAWFKLAPAAVIPLWLARLRGRALARALIAVLALSMALSGVLIALGGLGAPLRMLTAMSVQFTRSAPQTPWAAVGSVPLQQLVEAATLALLAGACTQIRRDGALAGDWRRICALAAAVLLGTQISANYWNYMYLVWVLPFIFVSLLDEPTDVVAPPEGLVAAHARDAQLPVAA